MIKRNRVQRIGSGQAGHVMLSKSCFSRPIKLAFTYAVFSSGICPVLSDGSIHGHPTKYQVLLLLCFLITYINSFHNNYSGLQHFFMKNNYKSGNYRAYGVRASIVLPGRPCHAIWWKRPRPLCFVSLLSRLSSVAYDGQLLLGVIKTIQVTTVLDKEGHVGVVLHHISRVPCIYIIQRQYPRSSDKKHQVISI